MDIFKIFIVEDDYWYGELLKYHLSANPDYEVHLFDTARGCLEQLHLRPDVVSIDFNLPDMRGEELLKRIQSVNNQLPVVVISAQEDIAVALALLKKGAYDYIIKDDNAKDTLWNTLLRIRETASLKQEVDQLKAQLAERFDFEKTIIGQSPALKKSFALIEKAIRNNINVSITGETGTGKEVVAKAIHYNSERRKKPFIAVNMAAIPRDLMESELFGYEKGAFTGAIARKAGKFEEADGGTIFLDEIAELDLNLQSKLLRVLQEREVTRIGASTSIKFDARLIIATHRQLLEEVKKGTFREDLYYRVIGLPIDLPPLRERAGDTLMLARHFIELFAKDNRMKPPALSENAKNKLMGYNYPGNVRELKAIVDLACVMSDGREIKAEDITFASVRGEEAFTAVEKTLKEYNADIISFFLKKYNNNVVEVADRLDIGKSTIYNLINAGYIDKNK